MTDYAAIAADTLQTLTEEGYVVTLKHEVKSSYPATVGDAWEPTIATTSTDVYVVKTMFSSNELSSNGLQSNSILATDIKYLVPATVTPATGDFIVDNSVVYRVINVSTVSPGGIPVLHKVQARL